jgi:hypothetical protein
MMTTWFRISMTGPAGAKAEKQNRGPTPGNRRILLQRAADARPICECGHPTGRNAGCCFVFA